MSAWIDSRELLPGGLLQSEIQKAIKESSAYAVVVSSDALQSRWVGKELRHALDVQKQRGKEKFPVIPLSLNGTKLGVLEEFFGEEPIYLSVSSEAGGIEAAMNAILVALGKRLAADVPVAPQPKAPPLEELVLELTDLKFHEQDGVRRASARARLVYEPATPGQPHLHSAQSWRFIAPLGPIEAEELRWYLENSPSPRARLSRAWWNGAPSARGHVARRPHGERSLRLGACTRKCRTPFLRLRGPTARSWRPSR